MKPIYTAMSRALSLPKLSSMSYWIVLASCLLLGCEPSTLSTLDDYQTRLERVSGLTAKTSVANPLRQPSVSEVKIALARIKMPLLEGLQLSHCKLGQIIAMRNSSLGQVMTPANQLFYEVSLIQALKKCLQNDTRYYDSQAVEHTAPPLKPNVRQLLERALTQKIKDLPTHIHNFIATEPAFRNLYRKSTQSLPLLKHQSWSTLNHSQSLQGTQVLYTALNYFNQAFEQLLDNPFLFKLDKLLWDTHMEQIAKSTLLPQYLKSAEITVIRLNHLTQLVKDITESINCSAVSQPERAFILRNIMHLFFIEQLQPVLSEWILFGRHIEDTTTQLIQYLSPHAKESELWGTYLTDLLKGKADSLQAVSKEHALAWQALLKKCQLDPR